MGKLSTKEKELRDLSLLVSAGINKNLSTRIGLAEACGISLVKLNDFFTVDREVYAKFKILRKTIKDIASDNIFAIVMDKNHPKNYDASKYIASNYKTDLDEVLEAGDSSTIEFDSNSPKAKSTVKITFSANKGGE